MTVANLINTLKDGKNWREVAELLGGQYTGAFWRLIAIGESHATVEQTNIVLRYYGLEPITETPAEAVAASGVDRVLRCSKRPNTALLVAVSGEVTQVQLKVSKTGDDVPVTIPVRLTYSAAGKRARRHGSSVLYMEDLAALPRELFKTIYGKTGNLAAIQAAAIRAEEARAG